MFLNCTPNFTKSSVGPSMCHVPEMCVSTDTQSVLSSVKKLQEYLSGGIRTHDLNNSRAVSPTRPWRLPGTCSYNVEAVKIVANDLMFCCFGDKECMIVAVCVLPGHSTSGTSVQIPHGALCNVYNADWVFSLYYM